MAWANDCDWTTRDDFFNCIKSCSSWSKEEPGLLWLYGVWDVENALLVNLKMIGKPSGKLFEVVLFPMNSNSLSDFAVPYVLANCGHFSNDFSSKEVTIILALPHGKIVFIDIASYNLNADIGISKRGKLFVDWDQFVVGVYVDFCGFLCHYKTMIRYIVLRCFVWGKISGKNHFFFE